MKHRHHTGFAEFIEFKTPNLATYNNAAGVSHSMYNALENSRAKKAVNRACKSEAAAIVKIAASRDLDEMIALELRLQTNDLEKYAQSERDRKNVEQGLADLESAIHSYNTLKNNPAHYKEFAKSFTDSNRDKQLDVPKDGMRYTLGSQATRLQNRQSLQMSEEEKDILIARRVLINALREEYCALQRQAVHSDDDEA